MIALDCLAGGSHFKSCCMEVHPLMIPPHHQVDPYPPFIPILLDGADGETQTLNPNVHPDSVNQSQRDPGGIKVSIMHCKSSNNWRYFNLGFVSTLSYEDNH